MTTIPTGVLILLVVQLSLIGAIVIVAAREELPKLFKRFKFKRSN